MIIAVEGCAHGELESIYNTIEYLEQRKKIKVDLLICCGDFQAVRNGEDLRCMAVPPKFYNICSFYKYYNGEKIAPILTIFIGGNHEASSYLQELPYGGWVAPNIYYLGNAGVVNVGGVRIAGLSGIYKSQDYMKGRYESAPYNENTKRSVYHIRNLDVFRLKLLSQPIDICLSHDWPRGIYNFGDTNQLLRREPFFRSDVESGQLGSIPAEELLHHMKPKYWFAGHMHCGFAAVVSRSKSPNISNDKLHEKPHMTKFLALDKCLPRRKFLQILHIGAPVLHSGTKRNILQLEYDAEWLAILQNTNHLLSIKPCNNYMPNPNDHKSDSESSLAASASQIEDIQKLFSTNSNNENHGLIIPKNFCKTATPHRSQDGQSWRKFHIQQSKSSPNPQTTEFCKLLGIDDPIDLLLNFKSRRLSLPNPQNTSQSVPNDSLLSLSYSSVLSQPKLNNSDDGDDDDDGLRHCSINDVTPPNRTSESRKRSLDSPCSRSGGFKRRNAGIYSTTDSQDHEPNARN